MAPNIAPISTSATLPKETTVAIIGGGIVGLSAALTLAERGIPAVVLEKGQIAAEQSSRNLGWGAQDLACRIRHPTGTNR